MGIRIKRRKKGNIVDNKEITKETVKKQEAEADIRKEMELRSREDELKRKEEELKRSIDETIDTIPEVNIVKSNGEIIDMIPVETKIPVKEEELTEWIHVEKKKALEQEI